jgi:hypothetical protein
MAVCHSGSCPERTYTDGLDPDDLAREIRQLAMDTFRGLSCPDASIDELTSLKRRFEDLLQQTQEPQAAKINRWLRGGNRAIGARLHPGPTEGLRAGLV